MFKKINPLCCILGFDGFDSDILLSLGHFYISAGYDVVYGNHPIKADLLVVARGDIPADIQLSNFASNLHFYSYVCPLSVENYRKISELKYVVITPSKEQISNLNFPLNCIVSAPPVLLDLWPNPKERNSFQRESSPVHVGNFKKYELDRGDEILKSFLSFLLENKVQVWGAGWDQILPPNQCMGPLPLKDLVKFYQKNKLALGIMYSWQRGKTVSGRFWQAPLSGCALLSEAVPIALNIPGVYQVNYQSLNIDIASLKNSSNIADEAYDYWMESNINLMKKLNLSKKQDIKFEKSIDINITSLSSSFSFKQI